ncbi:MAG: hypothetical protein JOS17DRAFT_738009, partial [Linnemannia elongata]
MCGFRVQSFGCSGLSVVVFVLHSYSRQAGAKVVLTNGLCALELCCSALPGLVPCLFVFFFQGV